MTFFLSPPPPKKKIVPGVKNLSVTWRAKRRPSLVCYENQQTVSSYTHIKFLKLRRRVIFPCREDRKKEKKIAHFHLKISPPVQCKNRKKKKKRKLKHAWWFLRHYSRSVWTRQIKFVAAFTLKRRNSRTQSTLMVSFAGEKRKKGKNLSSVGCVINGPKPLMIVLGVSIIVQIVDLIVQRAVAL